MKTATNVGVCIVHTASNIFALDLDRKDKCYQYICTQTKFDWQLDFQTY